MLLLAGALWIYLAFVASLHGASSLDETGRTLFAVGAFTQVAFLFFLAPGLAADLIVSERRRGTLEILLTTPLHVGSILLGKLLSRVALILVMVAASFPVISVSLLYGGVRGEQVLGLFIVDVAVILFVMGPALFVSAMARRLGTAAALSYVIPIFLAISLPMGMDVFDLFRTPWLWMAIHPFFAASAVAVDDLRLFPGVLPAALVSLAGGTLFCAIFVAASAFRLARECGPRGSASLASPTPASRPARTRSRAEILSSIAETPPPLPAGGSKSPADPADLPPPRRRRRRIHLFRSMRNPVLWKELNLVNASHSRALFVVVLILLGLIEVLFLASSAGDVEPSSHLVLVGAEAMLLLLVVAANSGACVASERESGSLDLLRVTLLTPGQIVRAKVAGVLRSLFVPALVPLLHVLAFTLAGHLRPYAFPFVGLAFAILLFFFAVSGVSASVRQPLAGRAVRRSIAFLAILVLGVPVALSLFVFATMGESSQVAEFIAFSNPIALAAYPVDFMGTDGPDREDFRLFLYTIVWLAVYLGVALLRFVRLPAIYDHALRRGDA